MNLAPRWAGLLVVFVVIWLLLTLGILLSRYNKDVLVRKRNFSEWLLLVRFPSSEGDSVLILLCSHMYLIQQIFKWFKRTKHYARYNLDILYNLSLCILLSKCLDSLFSMDFAMYLISILWAWNLPICALLRGNVF